MWQKHNLIDTVEKLLEVDQYLMNTDGTPKFPVTALDTETTGLTLYKTAIVGFSFSVDRTRGFYVPILIWEPDKNSIKTKRGKKVPGGKMDFYQHGRLKNPWTGTYHPENVLPQDVDVPDFVAPFIQRWFGQCSLLMWNGPFDVNQIFINYGVDLAANMVLDGGLLAHIRNENESTALKANAIIYQKELGINAYARADQEKKELEANVAGNGGKSYEVWRADLPVQYRYACADTTLTYGLIDVLLESLEQEHQEKFPQIIKWITEEEVMPVCREVVIPMKRRGVYIDVAHFQKLQKENAKKLIELEDAFIKEITPYLEGFAIGKSIEDAVSHKKLVKVIADLEGLNFPTQQDKKTGEVKSTLSKKALQAEYQKNPHWLWGYLLGEDEIKYSSKKLESIRQTLYEESEGRRYHFNINSAYHLIWLFFDKLGENRKAFPKTKKSTEKDWRPQLEADDIRTILLPKYAWVSILLKYRKILKIQSTYVEPALELQQKGWLYMDMKQNGTTSGRFSCSGGYNLQTLPRVDDELEALNECSNCDAPRFNKDGTETGFIKIDEYMECVANRICNKCGHVEEDIVRPSAIKKGFIAPPGYKIVTADYSSLEPRAFAFVSNEQNIKDVYHQGLDLYSKVYCDMFDKEKKYSADPKAPNFLKKVYPAGRKLIKPVVLAIPYGSGDAQVANLTGNMVKVIGDDGIVREKPNIEEGKRIRDLYLDTYPNLRQYMDTQEHMAIEYGFVDSKYGRRRHFEWAKKIGDFFERVPSLMDLDKSEKIKVFVSNPRSRLDSDKVEVRDFEKRRTAFFLTDGMLKDLSDSLGMVYTNDDPDKPGILEKGRWAYIRGLLKEELNNAKNHPIQGLAGNITNQAMLTTTRLFKQYQLDAWVCLMVHDELICYAREDIAEDAAKLLKKGMEENIFTVPLRPEVDMIAEPIIAMNLKEAK